MMLYVWHLTLLYWLQPTFMIYEILPKPYLYHVVLLCKVISKLILFLLALIINTKYI